MVKMPSVQVDLRPYFHEESRGGTRKSLIVLHETVSPDYPGLLDIKGPARYMDSIGLEVHGIIDAEANSAWCYDSTAIYEHALSRGTRGDGRVNSRSVGFELVSRIPGMPSRLRLPAWRARTKQLDKVAHWCAWLHETEGIPLEYSDSSEPGVTTHWSVSQRWGVPHGHWDCRPAHLGGHFPVLYVVQKARNIVRDAKAL